MRSVFLGLDSLVCAVQSAKKTTLDLLSPDKYTERLILKNKLQIKGPRKCFYIYTFIYSALQMYQAACH